MNKTIERDLYGLLPSLTGPLPRELTHLAASLVAQSRSKASSMKPEEEIARGYACAQIACERLKMSLNLPTVTSCPPLPPRIYKRVYTYISSALQGNLTQSQPQSAANTPKRTPSKRRYDALDETPGSTRTTPSKTPMTASRRSTRKIVTQDKEEEHIPDWTMTAIRSVCKILKMPYAAPHIFAGVSSITRLQSERQGELQLQASTPSKKRAREPEAALSAAHRVELDLTTVAPLVVCVALLTIGELSSDEPSSKEMNQRIDLCVQAVQDVVPEELRKSHDSWVADVETLQRVASDAGWTSMEWFINIEPATTTNVLELEADDTAHEMELEATSARPHAPVDLRILFGNVKAAATDWLGEERTIQYEKWKAGVAHRIMSNDDLDGIGAERAPVQYALA